MIVEPICSKSVNRNSAELNMFTTTKRLFWRICTVVRRHPIALLATIFVAAILLGANLCGWSRYSVEEDGYVTIYGMPFPYRILRCDAVFPGWPPQQFPPVLPSRSIAALGDAVIGLLLLTIVVVVLFRRWRLPSLSWRGRTLVLLAAVIALAWLATWGILVETTRYETSWPKLGDPAAT